MRNGNHLYEIEVREVDKEKEVGDNVSKFTSKVLAKIRIR